VADTDKKSVSDSLLESFDNVVAAGDELPIEELRKRYAASTQFRYSQHDLYHEVLDLPLTVEMVTGQAASVGKLMDTLKELCGDDLVVTLNGGRLVAKQWRDGEHLRDLWKAFAEAEYKSENLGGAA
jgi:hypothetical protein